MAQIDITKAMELFKRKCPDFVSFDQTSGTFFDNEISYKREAVASFHDIFGPYISGEQQLTSDTEAQELATRLFDLANFFGWRDRAYLNDMLFTEEGNWLQFMNSTAACLSNTPDGPWQDGLQAILDFLHERECVANITKLLPTFFLFLWDPENHVEIKPRVFDRALKALGQKTTGHGKPMTLESYAHVQDVCSSVKQLLADWHPQDNVDIHSFLWVIGNKEASPKTTAPTSTKEDSEPDNQVIESAAVLERVDLPLNLILAGPPGTGKTYKLLTQYASEFEQTERYITKEEFILEACSELKWHEACVIALALFGRPAKVSEIATTSVVEVKMAAQGRSGTPNATLWQVLQSYASEDCPDVNVSNRRNIGLFWKNGDSTWRLADDIEEHAPGVLELARQIREFSPRPSKAVRHDMVTFHQSYGYEDFVEGIKPTLSDEGDSGTTEISYRIVDGIFKRMALRAMADPEHDYCLFIDEINRANVSSVFGELITLLEPDKRLTYRGGTWHGGLRVKLPYTHSDDPQAPLFGVPDNLHVIGTMNTADRSIALMDLALRRRFDFEEMIPKHELLGTIETDDGDIIQLDKMLETMNQRIEYLYDSDHMIGHSYFMGIDSFDGLVSAFQDRIIPLLKEYSYGDWEKMQLILGDLTQEPDGDGRPKAHKDAIICYTVQKPNSLLGISEDAYQSRRSYYVNEDIAPASFQKIYKKV